jgi:hypothetical protein
MREGMRELLAVLLQVLRILALIALCLAILGCLLYFWADEMMREMTLPKVR